LLCYYYFMAIHNYLIEGVSGSGKSSVCDELKAHGFSVISGDAELAYNGDPATGKPVDGHGHNTWIWDVDKVVKLTNDKTSDALFFCGGSRNFDKFIHLFDKVFILDVDNETIKQRLAARNDNEWGKQKSELDMILSLNNTKEDLPPEGILIDATKPLNVVVDEIIKFTI